MAPQRIWTAAELELLSPDVGAFVVLGVETEDGVVRRVGIEVDA